MAAFLQGFRSGAASERMIVGTQVVLGYGFGNLETPLQGILWAADAG